jgi:hypothetical protein
MIATELNLARNMLGTLSPTIRRRLERYAANPSVRRWDDVYCTIVGSDGRMTVWQAWIATDPTAPRIGPTTRNGRKIKGWASFPSAERFRVALEYATH